MAASLRLRASSSSFGADVKTLLGGITDGCCMKRVQFQGQEGSDHTTPRLQNHCTNGKVIFPFPFVKIPKKAARLCNCNIRTVQMAVDVADIEKHLVKHSIRGTITKANGMANNIVTGRA